MAELVVKMHQSEESSIIEVAEDFTLSPAEYGWFYIRGTKESVWLQEGNIISLRLIAT